MQKKKKIIIISISIIFLISIICFIIFNSNGKEIVKGKIINQVEFSNLEIIKENDIQILTFTVENKNNHLYTLGLISIHLLKDNKELLVIPLTIDMLKVNEKKTIEYIIEEDLYNEVNDFYVSTYVSYDDLSSETIDDSLDSKLSNILKNAAKNIIENQEEPIENTLILTAYTMENIYLEDLGDFKLQDYNCSLDNSYVEVIKINENEYEYISYLDCEILYDE